MIGILKAQLLSSNKTRCEYYELCQKSITTTAIERNNNAEVLTPLWLVWEMTLKLPEDAFVCTDDRYPKIFDPCVGKGAFMVVLFDLLYERLSTAIPDSHERTRVILEDVLYFADINPFNIYITKRVLDPANEFKLNFYTGDTLQMDIKAEFKVEKFDIVVGNPPYNAAGSVATGNTLWPQFVRKTFTEWASGYVSFVHPSGWRKPCYDKSQLKGLFTLMTFTNAMRYLEIHNTKDGMKTFGVGTRYDWYVIKCGRHNEITTVKDEPGSSYTLNMTTWPWLPNAAYETLENMISDVTISVIMDSAYHATRIYVQNEQTDEFKYPLIHSTPKNGIRYMYSKFNDKGHFGISKVIFGESGIYNAIVDMDGKYGMTQGAMAIIIDSVDMGNRIKQALETVKFKQVLKSCMWGNFRIDWRLFTYFKLDFWQQFV